MSSAGSKPPAREHVRDLLADFQFELFEGGRKQFLLSDAILFFPRKAGFVGVRGHVKEDGILRRGHALVSADGGAGIEERAGMIHAGRADSRYAQLLKRRPLLEQDVGVQHGDFHGIGQRFFLGRGNSGHQERNQGVVAGQDAVARANAGHFTAVAVRDSNPFGAIRRSLVFDAHYGTAQADARLRVRIVQLVVGEAGGDDGVHRLAECERRPG